MAPWHGNYMLNYNFEQTFWPAFISNHAELAQPYLDRVSETFPMLKGTRRSLLAKDASEPPSPPTTIRSGTTTCYLHAASLRLHYGDIGLGRATFLAPLAVSRGSRVSSNGALIRCWREVARFYEWFLHRSQREDCSPYVPKRRRAAHFSDLFSRTLGSITPQFERNRDSASAIAFYPLPLAGGGGGCGNPETRSRGSRAVAATGASIAGISHSSRRPRERYLWMWPALRPSNTTFPCRWFQSSRPKTRTFWSKPEQVEIARRTARVIRTNGNNSLVMLGVVRARLGLADSLAQFLADVRKRLYPKGDEWLFRRSSAVHEARVSVTENFAAAGVIAEHLLQSHPDATGKPLLRLFPALPQGMDARFAGLLAEGGLRGDGGTAAERVTKVELVSRRGAPCRLLNPWKDGSAAVSTTGGKTVIVAGKVLEFPTQAGETYLLARR